MAVAPFRVYSTDECHSIAQFFAESVELWTQRWFRRGVDQLEFRNASEAEGVLANMDSGCGDNWLHCDDDGKGWFISIDLNESYLETFASLMLGQKLDLVASQKANDIVSGVQRKMSGSCVSDLGDTLTQSTSISAPIDSIETEKLARRAGLTGSGWGVLSIVCSGIELDVVLSSWVIASAVPIPAIKTQGGLDSSRAAIAGEDVSLAAELGGTKLTIGDFEKLRVGDVVRLDQPVLAPVNLATTGGVAVARGQLGVRAGHKALRLD